MAWSCSPPWCAIESHTRRQNVGKTYQRKKETTTLMSNIYLLLCYDRTSYESVKKRAEDRCLWTVLEMEVNDLLQLTVGSGPGIHQKKYSALNCKLCWRAVKIMTTSMVQSSWHNVMYCWSSAGSIGYNCVTTTLYNLCTNQWTWTANPPVGC